MPHQPSPNSTATLTQHMHSHLTGLARFLPLRGDLASPGSKAAAGLVAPALAPPSPLAAAAALLPFSWPAGLGLGCRSDSSTWKPGGSRLPHSKLPAGCPVHVAGRGLHLEAQREQGCCTQQDFRTVYICNVPGSKEPALGAGRLPHPDWCLHAIPVCSKRQDPEAKRQQTASVNMALVMHATLHAARDYP